MATWVFLQKRYTHRASVYGGGQSAFEWVRTDPKHWPTFPTREAAVRWYLAGMEGRPEMLTAEYSYKFLSHMFSKPVYRDMNKLVRLKEDGSMGSLGRTPEEEAGEVPDLREFLTSFVLNEFDFMDSRVFASRMFKLVSHSVPYDYGERPIQRVDAFVSRIPRWHAIQMMYEQIANANEEDILSYVEQWFRTGERSRARR